MTEFPLGREESAELEFKAAEALRRPAGIAREVVGMLNAHSPGEVWVGVREKAGKAIGVDPVDDAGVHRDRLINSLVDLIEPPPMDDEVGVEVVEVGRAAALCVHVGVSERLPFALLQREGRAFLVRNGSRNRALHLTELEDLIRRRAERPRLVQEELDRRVEELRADRQVEGLWLAAAFRNPNPGKEPAAWSLDLQRPDLAALLGNPEESGSRRSGWTVASPYATKKLDAKRLAFEYRAGEELRSEISLYRDGSVAFCAPPERLLHSAPDKLYPLALIEYCVSFLRLLAALVERAGAKAPARCRCALELSGIDGWELRPYSPDSMGYLFDHPADSRHDAKMPLEERRSFTERQLVENPDACAWELVRLVYEAFGMTEDKIPREFDPRTKRLRIGE